MTQHDKHDHQKQSGGQERAEIPQTRQPSQAEGDRATVEESLAEKGLQSEGAQTAESSSQRRGGGSGGDQNAVPQTRQPSQAEGDRESAER